MHPQNLGQSLLSQDLEVHLQSSVRLYHYHAVTLAERAMNTDYFVEAGNSAVQRGYSQELFQQSYEDLTNAGAKELEDVKKADKAAKEEREEKTKDWSTQIEFIVRVPLHFWLSSV